jgi:hypothetical protein
LGDSRSQDFDLILQNLDFLSHFGRFLRRCLDEIHAFVAFVFDDVIKFGKILQPAEQNTITTTVNKPLLWSSLDLYFLVLLLVILDLQLFGFEVLNSAMEAHFRSHEISCLLFALVVLDRRQPREFHDLNAQIALFVEQSLLLCDALFYFDRFDGGQRILLSEGALCLFDFFLQVRALVHQRPVVTRVKLNLQKKTG